MPWYWSDELAPVLVANGLIDETMAKGLMSRPVAHRSEQDTIEGAATELLEEDEISLAA